MKHVNPKRIFGLENDAVAGAETQWNEVIDRRSREIEEGKVDCRPVREVVQNIRNKPLLVRKDVRK